MQLDTARKVAVAGGLTLALWLGWRAAHAAADDGCNQFCQALIQAKTHARIAAEKHADSLVARGVRTKVVYVVARRKATEAVDALPPAKIVGTQVTLPHGTYTVAQEVADYLSAQRHAIEQQAAALVAADSALAASEAARMASDSAAAARHAEDMAKLDAANAGKPGRLARAWDAVKAPVAFIGGVVVGAVVSHVVMR